MTVSPPLPSLDSADLDNADLDDADLDGAVLDTDSVARASALVPLIREHASQGSDARRVAPEVIDAIDESDLFHVMVPTRLGGGGASLRTTIEITAEIARGDGSTGWVFALMALGTAFGATWSGPCQDDVFGAGKTKICGVFSPGDRPTRVPGGYRIRGRWPYASGSFAAEWASITIVLEDGGLAMGQIPREAFVIEPTWFVAGMEGTGSDTIVVDDHFIPDYRLQRVEEMFASRFATPHSHEHIANMPFNAAATAILVAPQLGLGRHALELTLARLPDKPIAYSMYSQAKNSPTHQIGVAKAATNLRIAELLLAEVATDIDTAASTGRRMDFETKARIRNDSGTAAELVNDAISLLLTANGAGSFADANVLNQIWRDSETGARHALVTADMGREAYGRLLLGNFEPTITL